jgi:hypothetical protein
VEKITATTPVPIVVANHEGEKLRTTRRQPWSLLEGAFVGVGGGSDMVGPVVLGGCEAAFTSPLLRSGVLSRSFSPAGVLMAGLSMLYAGSNASSEVQWQFYVDGQYSRLT